MARPTPIPVHPVLARLRRNAAAIGKPSVILNLNRMGAAMYVLRDYWPDCEKAPEFVESVNVEVQ